MNYSVNKVTRKKGSEIEGDVASPAARDGRKPRETPHIPCIPHICRLCDRWGLVSSSSDQARVGYRGFAEVSSSSPKNTANALGFIEYFLCSWTHA